MFYNNTKSKRTIKKKGYTSVAPQRLSCMF
nr:MAG TPA: hypothetical protein [Caudoviricetes sp.]